MTKAREKAFWPDERTSGEERGWGEEEDMREKFHCTRKLAKDCRWGEENGADGVKLSAMRRMCVCVCVAGRS